MNPTTDTTPQPDAQTPLQPQQPIVEPQAFPQAAQQAVPTPQPVMQQPQAPRPKKSYKKFFIIFAAVLLVIGLGVTAYFIICSTIESNKDAQAATISKDLPYQYAKPLLDVSESDQVQFPVDYDLKQLDSYKKNQDYSDAIKVFTDSSFTHPANVNVYPEKDLFTRLTNGTKDSTIRIKPSASDLSAQQTYSTQKDPVTVSPSGTWGPSSEYYIVRYLDEKGQKLAKPIVTRMTVKKALATPDVRTSVDDNGVVKFTWQSVDGAKNYLITKFLYKKSADGSIQKLDKAEVIGNTDKTSWSSDEQDETSQPLSGVQNKGFKTFTRSEDDLHGKTIEKTDGTQYSVQYGVIAANDPNGKDFYSTSAYNTIDGDALARTIPYQLAKNATDELLKNSDSVATIPEKMAVTLVDGSTVLRPVIIDTSRTKVENGKLKVYFKLSGTNVKYSLTVDSYSATTYTSDVETVAKRNIDAQQKNGADVGYEYVQPRKTIDDASKTRPEVPYTVNSTDEYSDYLAANMIAGKELIDVSKYADNSSLSLADVIYQVKAQNPYILGFRGYTYHPVEKIVEIRYAYNQQEREDYQKKLFEAGKNITAQIIKPGMTDRQKALAINNYIVNSASYNYEALAIIKDSAKVNSPQFRDNWSAVGILLNKSGVCQSYADAFKLLADAAGLKAILVTGDTDAGRHAWNKAFMDGKWQNIDVTWNDTGVPSQATDLFGLTDAVIRSKWNHVEDKYSLIDSLIPNYAAN